MFETTPIFDDTSDTKPARSGIAVAGAAILEKKDWSCIVTSDTDDSDEKRDEVTEESFVAIAVKASAAPPPLSMNELARPGTNSIS